MSENDIVVSQLNKLHDEVAALQKSVGEVSSKINNGLTERSIAMHQSIEELKRHDREFETRFIKHEMMEHHNVEKLTSSMASLQSSIEGLSISSKNEKDKQQEKEAKDAKMKIHVLWGAVCIAASLVFWVISESDKFGMVFGPLFK